MTLEELKEKGLSIMIQNYHDKPLITQESEEIIKVPTFPQNWKELIYPNENTIQNAKEIIKNNLIKKGISTQDAEHYLNELSQIF